MRFLKNHSEAVPNDSSSAFEYRQAPGRQSFIWRKLKSGNPKVNLILFLLTCGTTFTAGLLPQMSWRAGLWYSGGIISILLAHEMGHYLMCRKYGIQVTLPFFIPFIPVGFGTLGAVIRMESLIPSRKALFDVAVAGPIAGFVLTVPAIYFGAKFSSVVEPSVVDSGMISLGESILFGKLSSLAWSGTLADKDLLLHPLAYAGWGGLLVTALNLLPIGQLDGGHIVYAVFGRHHRVITLVGLAGFAFIALFKYPPWLLLLALLLWFGRDHPPALDERPVGRGRKLIGLLTLIIFVLSFTPQPIIM